MSDYDAHMQFCTLGHVRAHKGHLSMAGLPAEVKAGLFCVNEDGKIRKNPNKSFCVTLSRVCVAKLHLFYAVSPLLTHQQTISLPAASH